jgi:hypothetical protein
MPALLAAKKMKRRDRVIELITAKAMTSVELSKVIHCGLRGTQIIITKLRKAGLIHIQGYRRQKAGIAAMWRYGIGVDATKPPPVPCAERSRKCRDGQGVEEHAFALARQRAKKWKIKRDPLVAAFFGEMK